MGMAENMAANRVRQRLTRRAIAALILLNAALWAFALWGGHSRVLSGRHGSSPVAPASHHR
jgi:hypothetical protein